MITTRSTMTSGVAAFALAVAVGICGSTGGVVGASAPDAEGGLVLDGELIADAELLAAAQEEGTLTLYTSHTEEGELNAAAEFTADTGIDIEVVRLPGGEMHERVLSEHGAGVLAADVINASNINYNIEYLDAGIIEPYRINDELWDAIDDQWKEPSGAWYSTYISTMVIAYNSELIAPEDAPTAWADLLDPQWQGQIMSLSADIGGTGWAVALFQYDVLGEDYWTQLAEQDVVFQGASNMREEVVRGEYAITVNGSATMSYAVQDGAPIEIVWAEEGTPTNTYNLSMFADAPHPNAAMLYMNWRNSLRGLTVGVENSNTYVARSDAPSPVLHDDVRMPPFDEIKPYSNNEDFVGLEDELVPQWIELFQPGA